MNQDILNNITVTDNLGDEITVKQPDGSERKAEKIMELAKKLETEDEYICQDNRDLLELEQRYEKLDIPQPFKSISALQCFKGCRSKFHLLRKILLYQRLDI